MSIRGEVKELVGTEIKEIKTEIKMIRENLSAMKTEMISSNNVGLTVEQKATELRKEVDKSLGPIFSKLNSHAVCIAKLSSKVSIVLDLVIAAIVAITVQFFLP